jgi:N utilization substance protein A
MSSELFHTIEQIGREKGIEPEVIIQAIEEAYAAASRKYYKSKEDFGARFDRDSGEFVVFSKHMVVEEEELMDPQTELTVEEARELKPDAELGDVIETIKPGMDAPLSRIAAQAAKQVIYQKVKEAEREIVWAEYGDRVGDLITGQVKRFDRGDMILDLGRTEGIIPRREQSRAEHYNPGERVRAILVNVERQGKGPQLVLSRASELLVKKLFEQEVPEIYDSTVSVKSKDRDVDPVGACVGMKGSRVQAVIRELRGEKIDIVQFDEDSSQYVRNALNPAVINRVAPLDYDTREMEVIVGDDQLSLAIGKKGQNVRLAGKLTGWRLDIKSEVEKKAEIEAEMERMARANRELSALPGIGPTIAARLLDSGFRTIEEVEAASLEDLTSIDGIAEQMAIKLHDAAEEVLDQYENGEGPLAEIVAEEQARAEEAARLAEEEAEREAALVAEAEQAEAALNADFEPDDDETEAPEAAEPSGEFPAAEEGAPAEAETPGAEAAETNDDAPGDAPAPAGDETGLDEAPVLAEGGEEDVKDDSADESTDDSDDEVERREP